MVQQKLFKISPSFEKQQMFQFDFDPSSERGWGKAKRLKLPYDMKAGEGRILYMSFSLS